MKPGSDLAERLRAEAARLEVGAPPVAAAANRGRRRSLLRTGAVSLSLVAFSAASIGLGLIVTSGEEERLQVVGPVRGREEVFFEDNRDRLENVPQPSPADFGGGAGGGGGGRPANQPAAEYGFAQGSDATGGGQSTPPGESPPAAPPAAGGSTAKVIKTARLRLEVGEDSLSGAFAEVERLAGRHGGFVSDSFTRSDPARSGELTIRVPAAVFESVVADLKSLGRVEAQRISGVDVTADFVDLQARLRNWEAQERVLVRLMGEANTINESLQVQRELQTVRLEIERILGQLRVLRDQTELASISLSIHEPGAAEEPPSEQNPWEKAVAAAGDVLAAMLVGLGYLLPISAALLILWFGARAIRSRRPV